MKLYVALFGDNSYRIVISADDVDSAWEKAKEFIANNCKWYNINRIGYDMSVYPCDEDYVIK